MTVHIMTCLTVSFGMSLIPQCQRLHDADVALWGHCKAPGAVGSLFIFQFTSYSGHTISGMAHF